MTELELLGRFAYATNLFPLTVVLILAVVVANPKATNFKRFFVVLNFSGDR